MRRILELVLGLSLILFNLMMIGCFYLYFVHDRIPIKYLNQPFPVDRINKIYHPGEEVNIYVEYEKYSDARVTRDAVLVDSFLLIYPSVHDSGAPIGNGRFLTTFTIPYNFVPAENDLYHFEGKNTYYVNFMRNRVATWKSETFSIILKEDDPRKYRSGFHIDVSKNGEIINLETIAPELLGN